MNSILYPVKHSCPNRYGVAKVLTPELKRVFAFYEFLNSYKFLKLFTVLMAALISAAQFSYGQSACPTSNCVSNDLTITKVELVDANTLGALPNICQPGQQTVPVKLKVTFDATAQTRYGFLLIGTVKIDGQFLTKVWQCYPEDFTGTNERVLDQTINWPCGSTITLTDVYTAWKQQAPSTTICTYLNSDGTISNCAAIDPKCKYYGDQSFTVAAPLVANFTYSATCTGNSSYEQITFSSPSSGTGASSGGNKPYQFSWEIKDASTNTVVATSTNNPFTYQPLNNHDLIVKLTVTDASIPTTQTDDETKTVSVGLCCSPPTVTLQPSNQQKCEGSSASFTINYSGGNPAPSIQWQVSTDNGVNWSNLSNAAPYSGVTTTTLNISSVTNAMNGYRYRAVLQSGDAGICEAAYSNSATLSVNAFSVGGTVVAAQTICSGNQPNSNLTLSGNTGSVVKWQRSTTSNFSAGTTTDIANTTTTLLASAIGALTQDTWFRAVVQNGVCSSDNSASVKITVQQPITNNTIAASQTICSGNAPAGLTGSAPAGGDGNYSYQWQLRTSGAWNNIQSANGIDYTPGALNQTTQYRRIVTAGSACSSNTSSAITITISPESEVYAISSSNFCASAPNTGTITLADSYPGVSYQLKKQTGGGDVDVQAPQIGTGSALTWSNLETGTYYVYGTGLAPTYCTSQTATIRVLEFDCSVFYTLTQGYYGGKNGKSCPGTTPVNTILNLLGTTDMIIGTTNSITIPATLDGAKKLNQAMPGGSTATALPSGNCIITTGCFTYPDYLTKQGKINNVLLSQTITLSLNVRWNNGELLLFPIRSGWLTTQKMTGCGPDAVLVEDCGISNTISSIQMNQNVVDYLGSNATVGDLLQLANDVLGGTKIPGVNGVPSYSDVNAAVDAINKSFDEGRRFLDYFTEKQTCELLFPSSVLPEPIITTTTTTTTSSAAFSTQKVFENNLAVSAYPNPFSDNVNFVITTTKSGMGSLDVYNMAGQKVKTVYQGFIPAGTQRYNLYLPSQQQSSLIYIFRMGNERKTGKLINLQSK